MKDILYGLGAVLLLALAVIWGLALALAGPALLAYHPNPPRFLLLMGQDCDIIPFVGQHEAVMVQKEWENPALLF